jgi:hypothetical protein
VHLCVPAIHTAGAGVVYDVAVMLDPAVGALLAAAFALLFTAAALHKLLDPAAFAAAFRAYELAPQWLARLCLLVPLLELTAAAGLLAAGSRATAAGLGSMLLLTYALAIAVNIARGRTDLSCGCGGPNDRRPVARWMVWRNLVLAGALAVLLLPWGPRPLYLADALTIGAGTMVAALLYASLDGLLGRATPQAAA